MDEFDQNEIKKNNEKIPKLNECEDFKQIKKDQTEQNKKEIFEEKKTAEGQESENKTNGKKTTLLQCGHIFHDNCLGQWMNRTNSCPTCRSLLLQNDEDMGKQFQQLLGIQYELDYSLRIYPITYHQTGFTYTVPIITNSDINTGNSGGGSLWDSAGGSSGGGADGSW